VIRGVSHILFNLRYNNVPESTSELEQYVVFVYMED